MKKALARFRAIPRFNNWPLAIKFLVAMIIIASVPLVIVGFLNARNTQTALESTINDSFQQRATDRSALITRFIERQISVLRALSSDERIRRQLRDRNRTYGGSEEKILKDLLELDETWRNEGETSSLARATLSTHPLINPTTPSLLRFRELFNEHVEVFVTDARGGTLAATNMLSDYYQADEEWWQTVYNNGEGAVYISDPEFDESANITAILIAIPLFSEEDQSEIIGIIRSTIDIQSLVDEVADVRIGKTGRAVLLNNQGEVIADPNSNSSSTLSPDTIAHILEDDTSHIAHNEEKDEASIFFGHQKLGFVGIGEAAGDSTSGSENLLIKEAVDSLGWRVVVLQDVAEALEPVTAANRLAIITVVIAVLVAALVALSLARLLTRQLNILQKLFGAINKGDYRARAQVVSGDELGHATQSLNAMLDNTLNLIQSQEERDALQGSIIKLLEEVSDVAEGDLTVEAEVTADATGAIADSFNYMILQLREIISNVQNATVKVSSSANEIRTTAEHLSEGSETQSSQIISTSAALNEIALSIQQVSNNATRSAAVAEQALHNAQQGASVVQNTIDGMNRLRNQIQETSRRITRLSDSSQQIGDIVQLINDIADRTSILALNASIQAAMAGEAGQGFAVVAQEVESLAEQSAEATRQIANLVKTIQSETNEVITAMEESRAEAGSASELADQAGQALAEIENVSNQLAALIQNISHASRQQAEGSEEIARSMGEIANITQQTTAGTQQATVSIRGLVTLADDLRASVSTFKLPNGNGTRA